MSAPSNLRSLASSTQARGLNDHIAVRIVRISELLTRHASRTIESRWGLKNTDLRLLNMLDGVEPLTVSELSRRSHVDKAWVSRSLRSLEKRKLVLRRADKKDTRLALISLSAYGQSLLNEVRPHALRSELRMLRGIDARLLKRLLDTLEANAEAVLELVPATSGNPADPATRSP